MMECTIRFMGDVMIGRLVDEFISKKGYSYPWGNLRPFLHQEGLNVINLETTLTNSTQKVDKVFNFKAGPDKVKTLQEGNIHIANVANNHILDFYYEGLEETLQVLNKAGIQYAGAGLNLEAARAPVVVNCKGIKLGFIGCTDNEPFWKAEEDRPGTYYVKQGDLTELEEDILKLRKKVDILILSIHWGPNMVEEPRNKTRKFAHELIDLGVEIIHGHSAHNFQGVEVYKGKIIMYDTGDFVDDYVVDEFFRNDRSFLFECKIENNRNIVLNLIPVIISEMQVNLAEGHDYQWAMTRMQHLSKMLGTRITENGRVEVE